MQGCAPCFSSQCGAREGQVGKSYGEGLAGAQSVRAVRRRAVQCAPCGRLSWERAGTCVGVGMGVGVGVGVDVSAGWECAGRAGGRPTSGDGGREREIRTEGLLELKILYLILADSRVENVWEQAGPVQYKDAEGKTHRHFFDFLVLLKDGRRIAIAVRPFERSQGLKETLKLIGAQMGHFADGYLLLTNQHVARGALHNVIRIHAARRGPRLGHDQKIRDIAATINGRIKISDLVKVSGLEGDGFRAIARLIGAGELQLCERGRITSAAYVTNPKGMDVRPCE